MVRHLYLLLHNMDMKELSSPLLETGKVDVESKSQSGETPLSLAARNGLEGVVKVLLEIGKADMESKSLSGQTPLFLAAGNGHEEVVKLLLETGKVDNVTGYGLDFGCRPCPQPSSK